MVNLTTASLEPAPLSSGWKSGSLPTGFTPTILGARKGGRDAARCEPEGQEGLEKKGGVLGRPRPGQRRRRSRSGSRGAQCRVTPGAQRRGGGNGREREEAIREVKRAAPSSHRAARPPALAQIDVISASSVWAPTAQSKGALRGPTPRRRLSLAGAAQAQTSGGHRLRCSVGLKSCCVLPR